MADDEVGGGEPRVGWVKDPDGNWQQIDPAILAAAEQAKADEVAAAEAKKKSDQDSSGCLYGFLACVAIGLAVIVYGAINGGSDSSTTSSDRNDSSLACDHARNIAGDVSKGVLTDAELRAKLQEVDGNAAIATPAVQAAATRMLAAATTGTASELGAAMSQMDKACDASGN